MPSRRGLVTEDDLVTAVEAHEFETPRVAARERRLERVADAHGFEFRPYGGMLMHEDDGGNREPTDAW